MNVDKSITRYFTFIGWAMEEKNSELATMRVHVNK